MCSGYKPESFFYTQPAIGIKVQESGTESAIKPAAKPANETASLSSKKCKRDWWFPRKEEEFEKECDKINAACLEMEDFQEH